MTNMAAGEELDDYESWEDMEDNGVLDRKLEKVRAAMSTSVQKELRSSGGKAEAVVFVAEDGRTRYVPPEPTVKILKRPVVNNSHAAGDGFIVNGDASAANKPRQPIKTLQQREMEYAEARLRILGEAQSPEEKQSPTLIERIRRIQNKISSPAGSVCSPTMDPLPLQLPSSQQQPQQLVHQPQGLMCVATSPPPPSQMALPVVALNSLTTAIVCMATASTTITTVANNFDLSQHPQQPLPTCLNYSLLNHNHHHLHHHHQHPNYHLMNNHHHYGNNVGHLHNHAAVTGGNGNPAGSMVMPVVLRQPRGPDGTRGFHIGLHR